jgi:deoxyribonuclease V
MQMQVIYQEACRQQSELAALVRVEKNMTEIKLIAGMDVAYDKKSNLAFATAVLYTFPELALIAKTFVKRTIDFPYIPGLLSFRELPPLLDALAKLRTVPDMILIDGQGICHPRGLGLASHLGVVTSIATIGAAKSRLCGVFNEPSKAKGSYSQLYLNGVQVGVVIRTRDNVKPIYVSPGHMCDIDDTIKIMLACCKKYRIPEPQRMAHNIASEAKAMTL